MAERETKLEQLLQQELTSGQSRLADELVESYAQEISPVHDAVMKIVVGLALTTITIQFFYLQYILPAIGVMLLYLGMRTLRQGNGYFRIGWLLAAGRSVLFCAVLLLLATPCANNILTGLNLTGSFLAMLMVWAFGQGAKQAQEMVQGVKAKNPAMPVVLCQLIIFGLAKVEYQGGMLAVLLLLVAYGYALKAIYRCASCLDEAGYDLPAAPTRISGSRLMKLWLVGLLLGLFGLTVAFGYAPVEAERIAQADDGTTIGQSGQAGDTGGQTALRKKLRTLGFPQDFLTRIEDEDLQGLKEAVAVEVNVKQEEAEGDAVAIATADGRVKWFIAPLTQKTIWPALYESVRINYAEGKRQTEAKGKLFYTKGGRTYRAEIPLKPWESQFLWFGDINTEKFLQAKFSVPIGAQKQQAYFTYWTEDKDPAVQYAELCSATFYRQNRWIVLPYVDSLHQEVGGVSFSDGGPAGEKKTHVYFTPFLDGVEEGSEEAASQGGGEKK